VTSRKNSALHSAARVVLAVQQRPAASIAELAQAAGVSRRTVGRALRIAERTGLIAPRTAHPSVVVAREVRL